MSQADKLRAEIVRLEELRGSLDAEWPRVRWFALGFPLGIGLGVALGALWFWGIVLMTAAFLATSAYLIRVRRNEYTSEIAAVRRDLKHVR